jgi:hypothetical protein
VQVSRPLEEQLAEASQQLDEWIAHCREILPGPEIDSADDAPPEAAQLFATLGADTPADHWEYWVTEGGPEKLSVRTTPTGTRSSQFDAWPLLALVGLTIGTLVLLRQPAARDALYRWPHAAGFLVGIAVWAWLSPSLCGILIAAASLVFAIRTSWPGRSIRSDGSTVLQSPRATVQRI